MCILSSHILFLCSLSLSLSLSLIHHSLIANRPSSQTNDLPKDLPEDVEKVPTVYVYPAGDKSAKDAPPPRLFTEIPSMQLENEADILGDGARYSTFKQFVEEASKPAEPAEEPLSDEL